MPRTDTTRERRHRILDLLREHGRVTVEALPSRDDHDRSIEVKRTLHHAEKVRIARAAVALIRDGETVILDSGTTTAEIAKQIRKLEGRSINVITNALNIASRRIFRKRS